MKVLFTLMLFAMSFFAYSQEPVGYEYLSMVQSGNLINLSSSDGTFRVINTKDQWKRKNGDDLVPLLRMIQDHEEKGWELVSNNAYSFGGSASPRVYVLMRKKK